MYITKPYFRGIRGCVSTGYGISHMVGEHACMYAWVSNDMQAKIATGI